MNSLVITRGLGGREEHLILRGFGGILEEILEAIRRPILRLISNISKTLRIDSE